MGLSAILLTLLLTIGLVNSIRLPSVVQNVFSISQPRINAIPQFILDAEHPWLKENERWLSQYPGVRGAICDKTSSLWQHLPQDLFHNLQIDNNRWEISRLGWKNAADRLTEMKRCQAALQDVRHLHIDIFVHRAETSMPSPELAALLAEVLPSMTSLKSLDFGVSPRSSVAFEKAFADANVTLPSVSCLTPGAYSDWILPRCPNVEAVVAGNYPHHWSWADYDRELRARVDKHDALIDAMRGLPIRNLSLYNARWTLKTIQKIVDASPNLTMLDMDGPLNAGNRMRLPVGEALKRYLSNIAQFSHLEELHLPDSSDLDLDFDGGHWCGNAYMGKEGRAYGRAVARESAETIEVAAHIVHEALPRLKSFCIGSACPNMTENDAGITDMIWPWTGRMTEYTYEVWGP